MNPFPRMTVGRSIEMFILFLLAATVLFPYAKQEALVMLFFQQAVFITLSKQSHTRQQYPSRLTAKMKSKADQITKIMQTRSLRNDNDEHCIHVLCRTDYTTTPQRDNIKKKHRMSKTDFAIQ